MSESTEYVANGPVCGCCGQRTIPPTPGTDGEGFYCEGCGTAWVDPTQVVGPCAIHQPKPCDGEPRIEHIPGRRLKTTCPKCGETHTYPDTTSGAIP